MPGPSIVERMPTITREPIIANTYTAPEENLSPLPMVTSNRNKFEEFESLGIEAIWTPIDLDEIQSENPDKVAATKAYHAWLKNGGPAVVEETSLDIDRMKGILPPPYVKDWASDRQKRADICQILNNSFPDDRGATFRVILAYYDGQQIHMRRGETRGKIAEAPRDTDRFGFDDIFIPNEEFERAERIGQEPRTYSQMILEEKNASSARKKAVDKLLEEPFPVGHYIYQLPEPPVEQIASMKIQELTGSESIEEERLSNQALKFAYSMEATKHMEPNKELTVTEFRPFHRIRHADGAVDQYKIDPNSADQGVVIVRSIDLKTDIHGDPVRLDVDISNQPILLQMGPEQTRMALASRVLEFKEMHSRQKHEQIRALQNEPVITRTNTRSRVLEQMMGMEVRTNIFTGKHKIVEPAKVIIAPSELSYNRMSSLDSHRSRRVSRDNLILNTKYGPMSMLGLGGMPPTTGSKDALVTGAMSYMQSWIPRNGVFAGDFDKQLQLFKESRDQIREYGLDEDIEKICIDKLGMAIGCEDPAEIATQVEQFYNEGGRSVRIYTTNPDSRIIETAKAIRERLGEEKKDLLIAVGPVTDADQARALKREADVGMFLIGHGGGENCTSLEGGGAANSVAMLYELYLDEELNDCLLFMEGGVGTNYGDLLGMCDGFSLNKKAIGGIESTAGLYAMPSKNLGINKPVFAYHGSASPGTQLPEAYLHKELAERRLNPAGTLQTNEGKPNYLYKDDWVHSNVDKIRVTRELIGRALADQRSDSIFDIRRMFDKQGKHNIVRSTPAAAAIAGSHRGK